MAQANADVRSSTGHITLKAVRALTLQAGVDVATGGTGTLDILAANGSFTMASTATLATVNGDLRIIAGDDLLDQITLGSVTASGANVSIATTGSVLDSDTVTAQADDSTVDVLALGLRVDAGKGFGLLAGNSLELPVNAIETSVQNLSAVVRGSDGVNLLETDAIAIGNVASQSDATKSVVVQTVGRDGATATASEAAQSDVLTLATNGANGAIVLRTVSGSITLSEGTAANNLIPDAAVIANGSGNVLISAGGSTSDLTLLANADIRSTTGHITLKAGRTIGLQTQAEVASTGSGSLDIAASAGSLRMAADAGFTSVNGDIRLAAGNDVGDQIALGVVIAANANVSISTTGSVVDADAVSSGDDTTVDVRALGLRVDAGKGFGLLAGNSLNLAVNAIETTVDTLSVIVRGSDGVNVVETDALAIGNVASLVDSTQAVSVQTVGANATTSASGEATQSDVVTLGTNGANGSIVVRTVAGTLTLSEGSATSDLDSDAAVVANGAGNILLQAGGVGADLIAQANADVQSTTGHITLKAARAVDFQAGTDVLTAGAGSLDLLATGGSFTMAADASLGTVNGDIRIAGGSDVSHRVSVGVIRATNANVSITASGSVLDSDSVTAQADDATVDIEALGLRVDAGKGIGSLAGNSLNLNVNAIETKVAVLSAMVRGSDGMNIRESDGLRIDDVLSLVDADSNPATQFAASVYSVKPDAGTQVATDAAQSDLTTAASEAGGTNGTVVLRTASGDLVLEGGSSTGAGSSVTLSGSGGLRLEALAGAIRINSDITSASGHLTMLAGSGISVGSTTAAGVDIRSGGQGSALLDAGSGAVAFDGTASLDMGGNVQLRAGTSITLAALKGASVSLSAAG
ncbi:MAG: hypothetical protein EBT33_19330, partial [Betaproteobacteria bacterium]|nr:hypothetical protein [Betaproteobacteria bacterium]